MRVRSEEPAGLINGGRSALGHMCDANVQGRRSRYRRER